MPPSAFDMASAQRCYEQAVCSGDAVWLCSSDGIDALCRLAKQTSDVGWQTWASLHRLPCVRQANPAPGRDAAFGLACMLEAVALTEEALALAPRSARAHTAAAIASGRLALFTSDTRAKVSLCNRIRCEAECALQLDPGEDAAHHALGRWHLEVSGLNPVVRLVVRHLYGGDVQASPAEALEHYAQARKLAPERLAHCAEMGKALLKLGRRREAFQTLKQALQCDVEDVNAEMCRLHVEALLKRLRRQERQADKEARRAVGRQRQIDARAAKAARQEEEKRKRRRRRHEEEARKARVVAG